MFEMTNENFARLLNGLTIAVGNRKNRILFYQFIAVAPESAGIRRRIQRAFLKMRLQVDRQTKASYATYEAAEKAELGIKSIRSFRPRCMTA